MKWPKQSPYFMGLRADEHYACSSTRKKRISKNRVSHKTGKVMCNIVLCQKKKRISEKNREYVSSSTISSCEEEDNVFTSSTVVSTLNSIQHTTEMIETMLLSPDQLLYSDNQCEMNGTYGDDPCARQSKLMKKSSMKIKDDGDTWEERILVNTKNGKKRSFFYSINTGFRVKDEPPTGASLIIYLEK